MKQGKVFLSLGFMIGLLLAATWISGCAMGRQGDALETAGKMESAEASKSLPPINPEDVMRYGREVYLSQETGSAEKESSAKVESVGKTEDHTKLVNGDGADGSTQLAADEGTDGSTELEGSHGADGSSQSARGGDQKDGSTEKGSSDGTVVDQDVKRTEETKNGHESEDGGRKQEQSGGEKMAVDSAETKESTETESSAVNPASEDPCAGGHVYGELYVWREATCTVPADLCQVCVKCGAERHLSGGLAEHSLTKTLVREGNCLEPYEYRYDCANCDYFTYEKDYSQMENDHQYSTGSYQEFDENLLEWITITVTKCGICGKELERTESE